MNVEYKTRAANPNISISGFRNPAVYNFNIFFLGFDYHSMLDALYSKLRKFVQYEYKNMSKLTNTTSI